jgi:hypothetical protein
MSENCPDSINLDEHETEEKTHLAGNDKILIAIAGKTYVLDPVEASNIAANIVVQLGMKCQ